jgi:hypothetical protein
LESCHLTGRHEPKQLKVQFWCSIPLGENIQGDSNENTQCFHQIKQKLYFILFDHFYIYLDVYALFGPAPPSPKQKHILKVIPKTEIRKISIQTDSYTTIGKARRTKIKKA